MVQAWKQGRQEEKTHGKGNMSMSCRSPNSLLWGSLLQEKRLVAICSGRVPGACPPCVRHCPSCVRLDSALVASPHFVRHRVSALSTWSPLWLCLQTLCASYVCLLCVHHVSAVCPLFASSGGPSVLASGLCPLVASCEAGVASWSKILSQHCATRRVYIECPLVSFLGTHFGLKNCLGSMLV